MNKEDCLIELPNIKADINQLSQLTIELAQYWTRWDPVINAGAVDWGGWLKYDKLKDFPAVAGIINQLPPQINVSGCSFMKSYPGFHLKAHKDPRNASLLFVLTPDPSPVYFLDDSDNFILEHRYIYPTIINTHVRHGTNNTSNQDRITFQIGIKQPWSEIIQIVKDSGLA